MKIEVTVSAETREHLVKSLRLIADEVEREPDVEVERELPQWFV